MSTIQDYANVDVHDFDNSAFWVALPEYQSPGRAYRDALAFIIYGVIPEPDPELVAEDRDGTLTSLVDDLIGQIVYNTEAETNMSADPRLAELRPYLMTRAAHGMWNMPESL